ncbi:MAG: thymidylate synthase [Patescibacteria group bacterium]|nr:thymidylate synthase [Patescibacteria group bacterium]
MERDEAAIQSRNEFLPVRINAVDLPDSWFQIIRAIMEKGYRYPVERGSYEGSQRIELDFADIYISSPGSGLLVPDIPPGMSIPAPTELSYVEEDYFPRYLMSSLKAEGEQYTYGERIHLPIRDDSLGVTRTQIEWAIDMLKKTPGTNQATIEIAQPTDMVVRGQDNHNDPPCLRLIDCRVRYGKLYFIVYFRSWDAWGGYPANMGGLELLKRYMADEIGIENGGFVACSKGLHIYKHAEEAAKIRTYVLDKDASKKEEGLTVRYQVGAGIDVG